MSVQAFTWEILFYALTGFGLFLNFPTLPGLMSRPVETPWVYYPQTLNGGLHLDPLKMPSMNEQAQAALPFSGTG